VYFSRALRVRLLQTAHQIDIDRKMQSQPNSSVQVMLRVGRDNALLAPCDRTRSHGLARSSEFVGIGCSGFLCVAIPAGELWK
jgi:hypothetical protein